MIAIKLRQAMDAHRLRTGERVTYHDLARLTGLTEATLEAIGSRPAYRPGLEAIEKICIALDITPGDLLEIIPDPRDDPEAPDAPELPEPPEPPDNPEPPEPPKDPDPPKPPKKPFQGLHLAE